MKNIAKSCCCALAAMAALCGVAVATPVDGMMPVETGFGWKDGWVAEWKSDVPGLDVRDTSARVRDGLVKVIRRWTWNGKEPLEKVTLSVRYRVKGDPKQLKPFMPLATIFWFLNKTGSYIYPTKEFRVEYSGIPGDKILLPGVTTSSLKVVVSVKGSVLLTSGSFQDFLRIDLSKLNLRNVPHADSTLKYISDDDIRQQIEAQLPADFKFVSLQPDTIFLDFGRSVTKKVPVLLDADISFQSQYRAADGIILQPDSVEISTSAIIADSISFVKTEHLELTNLEEPVQRHVHFELSNEVTCNTLYTDLKINTEKYTEQSLVLPIRQINVPDSITMRLFPQTATVKFYVGWSNYQKITKDMFSLTVDYADLNSPLKSDILTIHLTRAPEKLGVTDIRISPLGVEYLIERNIINTNSEQ